MTYAMHFKLRLFALLTTAWLLTSLQQAWAVYDPSEGRWLSRDPLGEDGGINLYGYVGNNPIRFTDSLGLMAPGSGLPIKSGYHPNNGSWNYYDTGALLGLGTAPLVVEEAGIAGLVQFGAGLLASLGQSANPCPGKGSGLQPATLTGFRAVNSTENQDIIDSGQFRPSPFGGEGKYFFHSRDSAFEFGTADRGAGNFSVWQGNFHDSTPVEPVNAAGEGPAFFVPNENLPSGEAVPVPME